MADFNGTILTTQGLNLLAQAQAGETLQFTQVVLGSGTWSSSMNPSSMTSLVYPSQTVPIQSVSVVGDGTARLRFLISNSSLSLGYLLSEIGIYAQTTNSPNSLYAVTYANNPDFIPAAGVTTIEDVIDIYTVVSNAQSVTAVIDNSVMLATMQDLYTARPEFSSSTPTDLYAGKIWVSDTQPAQFYDGTKWQLFNAGLLDGYGVSATPTPNMLLPLNSNTQFPASVIPPVNASSVGGYTVSATPQPNTILPLNANAQFPYSVLPPGIGNSYANPVNLTSATADYLLEVGEVAYISFSNATSVPLNIATENGTYYEMDLVMSNSSGTTSGTSGWVLLNPNNTSYSSAFQDARVISYYGGSSSSVNDTDNGFVIGIAIVSTRAHITNFTQNKNTFSTYFLTGITSSPYIEVSACLWADTTTSWTSLGTITFPQASSGFVLVRRLA